MRVEKPWGYEIIWAKTDRYIGKILHINAGHRLSLQYHEKKEETIRVLSGIMILHLADKNGQTENIEMHPGDVYHIVPGTIHRMCGTGIGCEVLEVSTPELEDVIRLEDDYMR